MTSLPKFTETGSPEDLLRATARGDQDSFNRLYMATSAKLFGVVMRILKHRERSEEVLQEVYLRIWHNASGYRPEKGSPMTWMASIARNRALDWRRRDRGDASFDQLSERDTGTAQDPDSLDWAIASAQARALKTCLDELDAEQRDCIMRAYFEGYTHQELARQFDRPLGTVKSWIRRGLLRLKDCLER